MSILTSTTKGTNRIEHRLASDSSYTRSRPVELQTENDFSIIRRCDVDGANSRGGREHCFIVRDPYGYELDITVGIADRAIAEVLRRSQGRLSLDSSYWINCAERHLSTYLWENEDYPPDAKLTVDYLTPEDLDLARRWNSEEVENPAGSKRRSTPFQSVHSGRKTESLTTREPAEPQPIKLITENGYSIVRLSEIDHSATDTARECRFAVEDQDGSRREISVGFDDELIELIQRKRRSPHLSLTSKFWLTCAERYLATYLWENDGFPPERRLTISQLSDDELLLGTHWRE
jgi:hypothetical protein